MRLYVRATQRAALMLFKRGADGDFKRADEIDEQNRKTAQDIFDGLMSGRYDYAYQRGNRLLYIFTRSLRGNFVQESCFARMPDGEYVASSHSDIQSADKMEFFGGKYVVIH